MNKEILQKCINSVKALTEKKNAAKELFYVLGMLETLMTDKGPQTANSAQITPSTGQLAPAVSAGTSNNPPISGIPANAVGLATLKNPNTQINPTDTTSAWKTK